MTTSVAMCTFNGARFIESQIESILHQSLPIDEIVICDDGSTDGTIEIIEKYKEKFPNRFYLYKNIKSLGVRANFAKAIDLCTNDCIFLADQDDIWIKEKTSEVVNYFIQNPNKSVIISNANMIDEGDTMISNITLFDVLGLTEQLKYFDRGFAMEIFLRRNRATGCTMALRKSFKAYIHIPEAIPNVYTQIHDGSIAMAAIMRESLGYIEKPLTLYRQHALQQIGLKDLLDKPWHFATPLLPLNYIDTSYGVSHPRINMQLYRTEYIHGGSVLLHINQYYKAYGFKLMWIFICYDMYKKICCHVKSILNFV